MNNLEDYIFEQAKDAIRKIDQSELNDTYVYTFYVSDVDDDPRLPSLTVGYNTKIMS